MNCPGYIFCLMILMLIAGPLYVHMKKTASKKEYLIFKLIGTLVAVIVAIIGVHTLPSFFAYLTCSGLIFGLIGDLLLEIWLPAGGVSFFIGILCYTIVSLRLTLFHPLTLLFFLIFITLLGLHYSSIFSIFGKYKFPVLCYAILSILMFSSGLTCVFSHRRAIVIYGIGLILFNLSDYLLAREQIRKVSTLYDCIRMDFYYLGQLIIAISILSQ